MLLFLAVSHLVALIQTGMEIHITRDSLMNEVKMHQLAMSEHSINKTQIPVRIPSTKDQYVFASVDPADYDAVRTFSDKWRLSSSGYAVCTKTEGGRTVSVYMHRVFYPLKARHIDGNRLNNTHANLMPSIR